MSKENTEIDLIAFFKSVKWKHAFKWGGILMVAGIVIAFSIPKEYVTIIEFAPESSAKNQNQLLPSGLGTLSALTGTSGMTGLSSSNNDGVSMRIYPRILRSTPYLLEFYGMEVETKSGPMPLNEYLENEMKVPWWRYVMAVPSRILGLFRGGDENGDQVNKGSNKYTLTKGERKFIFSLRERLSIKLDEDTWTIKLSAKMQDPNVAAIVADSMMATLQRYMSAYRQVRAKESLRNTQRAYDEAYEHYLAAQSDYAEAMDSNQNLAVQKARIRLRLLENEYNVAYSVYQQMASQLSMAKLKLREDDYIATVIEPSIRNNKPTSPNKKIIIGFFTILGVAGYLGIYFVRYLLSRGDEDPTVSDDNE